MIHIRPATLPDLDSLVELLRLLFAIEADFDFEPQRQRRGLALLLVDPERASIMVAETEGKIVGMCSGQVLISTAEGGPALVVEDVVVQEAWRGHQIGRRLLEALEDWAAARGIRRLQLLADRNNTPAFNFYGRLGWRGTELVCLRRVLEAKPGQDGAEA